MEAAAGRAPQRDASLAACAGSPTMRLRSRRARWFLLPKDTLRFRLTGTVATDASDAGGSGLYDGRTGDWSPALVDLALIRREQLPPILPSDSVAGRVTAEASERTGLPAGLPVVVGLGDTAATRLGSLGTDADAALIYIGTAAWVNWPGRGKRGATLATTATGGALRWLRDVLSGSGTPVPYETFLAEPPRAGGRRGPDLLPHLSASAAPGNSAARGVFRGWRSATRSHLVRALLEGTCCHLRWLRRRADAGCRRSGRPARCPHAALVQIWPPPGRPAAHTTHRRAGALGAAILGSVGAGSCGSRRATAMVSAGLRRIPRNTRPARRCTPAGARPNAWPRPRQYLTRYCVRCSRKRLCSP